jgi:ABC-type multidrug transport system ATPase subunit
MDGDPSFRFFPVPVAIITSSSLFTMNGNHHTLLADNIQLAFGPRRILSDISIRCETGSITGLLGRNGSGKSCLLRILYGDLAAGRPGLLLYLPQYNFIPVRLLLSRIMDDYQLEFCDMEKIFPELGLTYRSRIRDLSGGHQRLINLYIVIRSPSQFALLDEPFTHLMPLQIEKVKELLLEEKARKGWLITDHLYLEVTSIADRLYLLADGVTHLVNSNQDLQSLGYIPR